MINAKHHSLGLAATSIIHTYVQASFQPTFAEERRPFPPNQMLVPAKGGEGSPPSASKGNYAALCSLAAYAWMKRPSVQGASYSVCTVSEQTDHHDTATHSVNSPLAAGSVASSADGQIVPPVRRAHASAGEPPPARPRCLASANPVKWPQNDARHLQTVAKTGRAFLFPPKPVD